MKSTYLERSESGMISFNCIYSINQYIKTRQRGYTVDDIQKHCCIDEATAYTWELGYQCYLKKLPLDKAIEIIKSST